MSNVTRIKIQIDGSEIELEGSEAFVTKYLEEFKTKLEGRKPAGGVVTTKQNKTPKARGGNAAKGSKQKKKNPGQIQIEEFETKANKTNKNTSLANFFTEKNPPADKGNPRILVIAYYLTKFAKIAEFTEGNIEFAFKVLKLKKRPAHLRQVLINIKNTEKWLQAGTDETKWRLSRIGELHVEDNMPATKQPKK